VEAKGRAMEKKYKIYMPQNRGQFLHLSLYGAIRGVILSPCPHFSGFSCSPEFMVPSFVHMSISSQRGWHP